MRGTLAILVALACTILILPSTTLDLAAQVVAPEPRTLVGKADGESDLKSTPDDSFSPSPSMAIVAIPVVFVALAWLAYIFRIIFQEPEDTPSSRD